MLGYEPGGSGKGYGGPDLHGDECRPGAVTLLRAEHEEGEDGNDHHQVIHHDAVN